MPVIRRFPSVFAAFLALALGCSPLPSRPIATPPGTGRVRVRFEFPALPSGQDLRFRLGRIEAHRAGGEGVLLQVDGGEIHSARALSTGSQPILGGELEPGTYDGVALEFVEATLVRDGEEVRLEVSPRPVSIALVLSVLAGSEATVTLALDVARSIQGTRFLPVLSRRGGERRAARALLLVALEGRPEVVALDRRTGEQVGSVRFDAVPGGIALGGPRLRLYVALPDLDSVALVDLAKFQVLDRARVPFGSHPLDVTLPARSRRVFATGEGTHTVLVFDARTMGMLKVFDMGREPERIESDPRGDRVYAVSPLADEVRIFDARTPRLLARVPVDPLPVAVAFTRDGRRYLVGHRHGDAVLVFDARTDAPAGRIVVGPGTVDLEEDPFSSRIYVAQESPQRLLYLSGLGLSVSRSLPLPASPRRLVADPDQGTLFVIPRDQSEVLLVDRAGGAVLGTFPLPAPGTDAVAVP